MAIMKGGTYVEGAPKKSRQGKDYPVKIELFYRSYPRLLVTDAKKRYRGQGK